MNIVVTGAAHGLGAALTQELRARGHQIIELDLSFSDSSLTTVEGGWRQIFDVADAAAWEMLAGELGAREIKLDAIINNAGIGVYGAIPDVTVEDWRRQLDVSLSGPWYALKYLTPLLGDGGRVLNIGSRRGLQAVAARSAYCAAKFGLRGLSLAAAAELPGRVGIAELDSMLTDFSGALADKQARAATGERFLHPEEVAKVVADVFDGRREWLSEWRLRATEDGARVELVTDELW